MLIIESFLKYLIAEKQYSELTIISYREDLTQFAIFLGEDIESFDPEKVTHKEIRSFIMTLAHNSIALSSINRKISALRSFFNYLRRKGIVEKNPTAKILSLKTPQRLPHFIERSKGDKLLTSCVERTDNFIVERNSTILLLFYTTGIRLAELISLNISSINFELEEIKVLGKGKKERISPLPKITVTKLREYLSLRSSVVANEIDNEQVMDKSSADSRDALFINEKGVRISRSAVYNLVNKTLVALGVDGNCSPHLLRHTFATHLISVGVGIESVKELLGHENLATTQIYTHNSIEQLKEVYKAHFEK